MIIAFLYSLFGLLFLFRMCKQAMHSRHLDQTDMTKIGTLLFLSILSMLIASSCSVFCIWMIFAINIGAFYLSILILKRLRQKKFRRDFVQHLNVIILKMRSGKGFRASYNELIEEACKKNQAPLLAIYHSVVFSQQNVVVADSFIENVVSEFKVADQQVHQAVRRLVVLRDRLKIEDEFRRRSGQVLSQIRAQAVLMSVLYFAVLFYVGFQFGWHKNMKVIASSAVFFAIGLFVIFFWGRKYRWKV